MTTVLERTARLPALVLALAMALGLALAEARAQEAEPPPEPQAIPVPEITTRAELVEARLRAIETSLESFSSTPESEETLRALDEELRMNEAALEAEGVLGLAALTELETTWKNRRGRAQRIDSALTERAVSLEEQLAELDRERAIWQETRAQALKSDAPAALLQNVSEVLALIRTTRSAVDERRGAILTLQTQVSEMQRRISATLDGIALARSRARGELLAPDRPPLWRAFSGDAPAQVRSLRELRERDLAAVRQYFEVQETAFSLHLLLFLGLLFLTLYLRQRSRRWAQEDPDFASTAELLRHPLATAVLVSLVATLWLYPGAPSVVTKLVGLVLLLPILRLVPALIDPHSRPILYFLAALFVVSQIGSLVEGSRQLERGLLLGESAVALAGLFWLQRPQRLEHLPTEGQGLSLLRFGMRAAGGFFVLSLALNAFGYFDFARVLADGVIYSAYAGFILFAAVTSVHGLLRALLRVQPLRLLHSVRQRRSEISRSTLRLANGLGFAAWVYLSLGFFQIRDPVVSAVGNALTAELTVGNLELSLGDVLAFVVVVALGLWLARVLRTLLELEVIPRSSMRSGVGYAVSAGVQYTVGILAFLVALSAAGFDMSRFALVAGALGVGIGFGLQNIVNNFVSGLILLLERPVEVGDSVESESLLGEVRRIGIRSSTIRTWQGAEVIVPNSLLISERLVNWTKADRHRRIDLGVGVAYGTDPEKVLALLLEVAAAHGDVLRYPEPVALFLGFGDSSLNFELRAWTARFERWPVLRSELAVAVNRTLADAGITIPFPQRDLHVKSLPSPAAEA